MSRNDVRLMLTDLADSIRSESDIFEKIGMVEEFHVVSRALTSELRMAVAYEVDQIDTTLEFRVRLNREAAEWATNRRYAWAWRWAQRMGLPMRERSGSPLGGRPSNRGPIEYIDIDVEPLTALPRGVSSGGGPGSTGD